MAKPNLKASINAGVRKGKRKLLVPLATPISDKSLKRFYHLLEDGFQTPIHVVYYPRASTTITPVIMRPQETLLNWCREHGAEEAISGGFYKRPQNIPLGEHWILGQAQEYVPFRQGASSKAALSIEANKVRINRRDALPKTPQGHLVQAGPLLVRKGMVMIKKGTDPEAFSLGAEDFDSDITEGRYPRAALGMGRSHYIALACDGRARNDAGLSMLELAMIMVELGAYHALNLDGGGSTSLVHGGQLLNRPRGEHGIDLPEGRPITSALVFTASDSPKQGYPASLKT